MCSVDTTKQFVNEEMLLLRTKSSGFHDIVRNNGFKHWTRGVSQNQSCHPFQLSKPGGSGVERVANFVKRVSQRISTLWVVLKFSSFRVRVFMSRSERESKQPYKTSLYVPYLLVVPEFSSSEIQSCRKSEEISRPELRYLADIYVELPWFTYILLFVS